MPTIGSATKTIRFNPSDLGLIESVMKKENTTFNNAVHLLINGNSDTPKDKKIPKSDYESIAEMARLMQVSTDGLLTALKDALEEGTLYYANGKLINPRYEEFERACGDRDIDKILNSMIRSL